MQDASRSHILKETSEKENAAEKKKFKNLCSITGLNS
jgi:hypothetical protein